MKTYELIFYYLARTASSNRVPEATRDCLGSYFITYIWVIARHFWTFFNWCFVFKDEASSSHLLGHQEGNLYNLHLSGIPWNIPGGNCIYTHEPLGKCVRNLIMHHLDRWRVYSHSNSEALECEDTREKSIVPVNMAAEWEKSLQKYTSDKWDIPKYVTHSMELFFVSFCRFSDRTKGHGTRKFEGFYAKIETFFINFQYIFPRWKETTRICQRSLKAHAPQTGEIRTESRERKLPKPTKVLMHCQDDCIKHSWLCDGKSAQDESWGAHSLWSSGDYSSICGV